MRRVGTVVRAAQGLAVARSPDAGHPDIGATVVDEGLDPVGRVVDVMGPTDRPYVVVKPDAAPATLLDRKLYVR
jgi:RNA-binding protein